MRLIGTEFVETRLEAGQYRVGGVNLSYEPGDSLDRLPGIGPRRLEELRSFGFSKIADLLFHLPSGWEDRRRWTPLSHLPEAGSRVLVRGVLCEARFRRGRRRGFGIITARIEHGEDQLGLLWFNARNLPKALQRQGEIALFGVLREDRDGNLQLINAEIVETVEDGAGIAPGLIPVYRDLGSVRGLTLRRIMVSVTRTIGSIPDPLSASDLHLLGLPDLAEALRFLHVPPPETEVRDLEESGSPARRRLFFDQALLHFLTIEKMRERRAQLRAPRISCSRQTRNRLREMLPFALTSAQERVFKEILSDMEARTPMARLLQGDVGSGKTAVAALAMAAAVSSGCQAVLMAPTEILAEQHARVLRTFFAATPWRLALLRGGLTAAEGRKIREAIRRGEAEIIIGTHALIQERVEFRKLGLAIIDEQHRFGTLQRRDLVLKGDTPHLLVMTATPIPRSLALTLYGDLDLSLLDEKPAGRRPIRTEIRMEDARERIYAFLRREIEQGGRVYCVYPLIEASEHVDAPALLEQAERVRAALPCVEIGILHGRMSSAEKERVQAEFRSGKLQMLLATTVIEVGVDVPEATVMIIEGATRFGLSQLHQLRGRVGRGKRMSWCIVMLPSKLSRKARDRLRIFAATQDGFELAEEDLKMRGPGELGGTRQWGAALPFDPAEHRDLVIRARDFARELGRMHRADDVNEVLAGNLRRGYDGSDWRGMTG